MEIGENMGALEIVLLAAGAVIFIASFCIPVRQEKLKEETRNLAAQEVKDMVAQELEHVHGKLEELSAEEMQHQIEKSERSMERISNEKIMAVNEYSDTVLDEIHKSHEEVVFLYDMLKNKKESLTESYGKADQEIQDLLQQVKDSEITVRENLAALEKKQRSSADSGVEAASDAGAGQRGNNRNVLTGIEALSRQASAAGKAKETGHTVYTEAEASGEAEETAVFQPFVPEKIEAAPKKRHAGKAAKKPEGEPEEKESGAKAGTAGKEAEAAREKNAGRRSSGRGRKASGEKEDMMPVSSDTAENDGINSNGRILELHRAGKSNMAIARELGLGIGEVKLVIDLYEGLQ